MARIKILIVGAGLLRGEGGGEDERNNGRNAPNRGVVVCANAELKLPGEAESVGDK